MKISIIVAIGRKREIGRNGRLLWSLSEDLKNFKRLTMGHHIVMGRKTFESIGKALPGRKCVVLSKDRSSCFPGCITASSLDEAIELAKREGENELFIAGGQTVYESALPLADFLYLSQVDFEGEADTFFPDYLAFKWEKIEEKIHPPENGSPSWTYSVLRRLS
ncbi:MAG: dihydrofolate reductase [Oligoflexales bacterium]|nr:dihydrofolate reductase [Oligoflexales bacterium]